MPRTVAFFLATCVLSAGCGLSAGDPPGDAVKKELKAMAGTWRPVSTENNGFKATDDQLRDDRWVRREDGTWTFRRGGETLLEWRAKSLDPAKSPKAIDIEVMSGVHKGMVHLGIYELDGDTLRICFAMPDRPARPTEFTAGKGSGRAMAEFKREKK